MGFSGFVLTNMSQTISSINVYKHSHTKKNTTVGGAQVITNLCISYFIVQLSSFKPGSFLLPAATYKNHKTNNTKDVHLLGSIRMLKTPLQALKTVRLAKHLFEVRVPCALPEKILTYKLKNCNGAASSKKRPAERRPCSTKVSS